LGVSKNVLRFERQMSAAYAAGMGFKASLYFGAKTADTPLEVIGVAASIAGAVGGSILFLALLLRNIRAAIALFIVLGVGHILYALIFSWLWEGDVFGYARAGVSAWVGLGLFAFARWVADAQPAVPGDGPRAARSARP
jgi:hypothetical protein